MSGDPLMAMIEARSAELVARAEQLERWRARGEGTAADAQLALLADEGAFLHRLAHRYVERTELALIERRCARLAVELGVEW